MSLLVYKRIIIKKIIDGGEYDLIYCHTPLPSFISRLAARNARKKGAKVLYMAHGFHFYRHAPIKNWLLYYPIEYFLSFLTDGIITMNSEDFQYVNGKMFHKDSFLIPGMGVDKTVFYRKCQEEKENIRKKLGILPEEIVILYVAEFIDRKNHKILIDAFIHLAHTHNNVKLLLAGKGLLMEKFKRQIDSCGLDEKVKLLGFRTDIFDLVNAADIGVSTSKSEGLPIGILQKMAVGLPIVATMERGHNELIINGYNGFLVGQNDLSGLVKALSSLIIDKALRDKMGLNSFERSEKFSLENSIDAMADIFNFYRVKAL